MSSTRVGVACPGSGERAAFSDWLRSAGLEPVLLVDACLVTTDIAGLRLNAVVADASLLTREFIGALRRIDARLPIMAVGDPGDPAEATLTRRSVSFYPRPLDQPTFMLAVSLVMAEARPARRSLRRLVPRLPSRIDGTPAFLLDVSNEGLRIEVAGDAGAKLGPHFQVQVPIFNVGVNVRRVWVSESSAARGRVQCGASLTSADPRSMDAWRRMLENAPEVAVPAPAPARPAARRPAPAKVEPERFFGRVAQLVADAPIVGSLTQLPWRSRH